MKVGDLVMFIDEGRYAKWFYGRLGICEKSSPEKMACSIRWLEPVEYFGKYTSYSNFHWRNFEIVSSS